MATLRESPRSKKQVEDYVRFWLEDHPEVTSIPLRTHLWVDDFDGSAGGMFRMIAAEFVKHGWRKRTLKGVETLVKNPVEAS